MGVPRMTTRRKGVAICALAAGLLAGGQAVAQETLTWLEWWDPEYGEDVMDELVAGFEAETGIKVERTAVPWDNMFELLVSNARAGTADYDVLGMEAEWLTAIDRLGGLEPLDGYLEKDAAFAETLTNSTLVRWRDSVLMMNWYIFPYSYTYNVDLLEEAGVEPPSGWDEVVPVSEQIAESSSALAGIGALFNESGADYVPYYLFGSRLAQAGGRFFDDAGNAVFNSPEGVAALEWWMGLNDSGVVAPGAFGVSKGQLREQFATGKIAAMWDGPFASTIAKQTNPDINVAYAPAWCDATCGYQWGGSGLAISANTEKKDAAWQFIKYLLSEEVSLKMTETAGIPFATNAAVASLEGSDDPILMHIPAMMQDAEHNLTIQPIPETEKLHNALANAFVAALRGDASPQQALDDAAAVWNEALASAR